MAEKNKKSEDTPGVDQDYVRWRERLEEKLAVKGVDITAPLDPELAVEKPWQH